MKISPIFYMGNKRRLIKRGLIDLFPEDINIFVEPFGGSGIVSMNVKANKYLMRRPRATQTDSQSGNSKQFGAPTTEVVIRHQLELVAQYIEDYCSEIWFEEIIEELIHYSYENKRKFDIVAAMGMCELGDEELQGFVPKPVDQISSEWRDIVWYTDKDGYKRKGVKPVDVYTPPNNLHKINQGYDYNYSGYRDSY